MSVVLSKDLLDAYVRITRSLMRQDKFNPLEVSEDDFYKLLGEYAVNKMRSDYKEDYLALSDRQLKRIGNAFLKWQKQRKQELLEISLITDPFEKAKRAVELAGNM